MQESNERKWWSPPAQRLWNHLAQGLDGAVAAALIISTILLCVGLGGLLAALLNASTGVEFDVGGFAGALIALGGAVYLFHREVKEIRQAEIDRVTATETKALRVYLVQMKSLLDGVISGSLSILQECRNAVTRTRGSAADLVAEIQLILADAHKSLDTQSGESMALRNEVQQRIPEFRKYLQELEERWQSQRLSDAEPTMTLLFALTRTIRLWHCYVEIAIQSNWLDANVDPKMTTPVGSQTNGGGRRFRRVEYAVLQTVANDTSRIYRALNGESEQWRKNFRIWPYGSDIQNACQWFSGPRSPLTLYSDEQHQEAVARYELAVKHAHRAVEIEGENADPPFHFPFVMLESKRLDRGLEVGLKGLLRFQESPLLLELEPAMIPALDALIVEVQSLLKDDNRARRDGEIDWRTSIATPPLYDAVNVLQKVMQAYVAAEAGDAGRSKLPIAIHKMRASVAHHAVSSVSFRTFDQDEAHIAESIDDLRGLFAP